MKSLFIFCFVFVTASFTVSASEDVLGVITGQVFDKESNQPLPYVNIEIQDGQGKTISGTITDDKGYFEIKKIPQGNFKVLISFIGYETFQKKIEISKKRKRYDLGKLTLSETSSELDEVVVVAEKSTVEQKIDRKVINVGKDLTSVGATAASVLNNVQSVSVDSQSGNISLRGNENVRILVDGKPTNVPEAQLLKQIPSTSIKSVELITNPSAKYNPEGMSGIINIILHKNSNLGFNGSVNTGLTYGENPRYNYSTNMNFKTGRVNFFGNYGYNNGDNTNYGIVLRDDNSIQQDFNFESNYANHILKVGADYYINDKHTLSVYTTQNKSKDSQFSSTFITGAIHSNSPSDIDNDGDSKTYDFAYTFDIREGEKLELEANISNYDREQGADFYERVKPYDNTRNYTDYVVDDKGRDLYNLDYTKHLSEKTKLELGLEARYNRTKNSLNTTQHNFVYDDNGNRIPKTIIVDGELVSWYETAPIGNSSFRYDRDIYSVYANYNQQFDKLTMQLGARLENYEVRGDFAQSGETAEYTDKIFTVYPSAFFTYNPNEKNQYQFSYSRRVDRPSIQQVNPIREWSTPLITSIGNPELRPQFTNSFEISYMRQYEKGSFTVGTFLRKINDNITRVLNIDEFDEDKLELSYINSAASDRYGFELSSNHAFSNWWRMNASMDLYIQRESGIANNELIEVQNNAFNFRINNNFTATKDLRLQLFAMYRGGGQSIQFNVDPMWMVNTGASYNILKGKGTLTLNFNDIFKGMKFKFTSDKPIPQRGQFNWESRTVFLGFMYNFGGGKNKARKRKNRDSNEASSGGFI